MTSGDKVYIVDSLDWGDYALHIRAENEAAAREWFLDDLDLECCCGEIIAPDLPPLDRDDCNRCGADVVVTRMPHWDAKDRVTPRDFANEGYQVPCSTCGVFMRLGDICFKGDTPFCEDCAGDEA